MFRGPIWRFQMPWWGWGKGWVALLYYGGTEEAIVQIYRHNASVSLRWTDIGRGVLEKCRIM